MERGHIEWTRFCNIKGICGNVSQHCVGKRVYRNTGSYIRSITSGATMPSMKELFNIMVYFEVSPSEFFSGLQGKNSLRAVLGEKLRELSDVDLEKVSLFVEWITEKYVSR